VIIDEDLGISGAGHHDRHGFKPTFDGDLRWPSSGRIREGKHLDLPEIIRRLAST